MAIDPETTAVDASQPDAPPAPASFAAPAPAAPVAPPAAAPAPAGGGWLSKLGAAAQVLGLNTPSGPADNRWSKVLVASHLAAMAPDAPPDVNAAPPTSAGITAPGATAQAPGVAPVPGPNKKQMVMGAIGRVLNGLGDSYDPNGAPGLLQGMEQGIHGQQVAAQAAKDRAGKAAQQQIENANEKQKMDMLQAHTNIEMRTEQRATHMAGDKAVLDSIAAGKKEFDRQTNAEDATPVIIPRVTFAGMTDLMAQGKLTELARKNALPIDREPVMGPDGKQAVDEDGNPDYETVYAVLGVPKEMPVDDEKSAEIEKYTGHKVPAGTTLDGGTYNYISQQVENNRAASALRNKARADADLEEEQSVFKSNHDYNYVMTQPQVHNDPQLAIDFIQKNPTLSKKYPNAQTDIRDAYGKDLFDKLTVAREAAAEKNQVTANEKLIQDREDARQARALAAKQVADQNDQVDAFGNKSPLSDKEFNKRYDSFTNSQQNKTLQTLEGSYQQFGSILDDINSGKDMTGAESVVALFNAIGISATPLAGKGFRINNNTVQEHANALGWGDKINRLGLKVKEGDVITPDQVRAYANIAKDVYAKAYVNAANEQLRTMGYTDVLPRGNNQPIDPVTHGMYLQVAGGNGQKAAQAEQKQGWAQSAPQVGEIRSHNGDNYKFDGRQWVKQ